MVALGLLGAAAEAHGSLAISRRTLHLPVTYGPEASTAVLELLEPGSCALWTVSGASGILHLSAATSEPRANGQLEGNLVHAKWACPPPLASAVAVVSSLRVQDMGVAEEATAVVHAVDVAGRSADCNVTISHIASLTLAEFPVGRTKTAHRLFVGIKERVTAVAKVRTHTAHGRRR